MIMTNFLVCQEAIIKSTIRHTIRQMKTPLLSFFFLFNIFFDLTWNLIHSSIIFFRFNLILF